MTSDDRGPDPHPEPGRELRGRAAGPGRRASQFDPRPLLRPRGRRDRGPRLGLRRRLTSVEPQPTHRYTRDGLYTVVLHVTAWDGRVGSGVPPDPRGDARHRAGPDRRARGAAGQATRRSSWSSGAATGPRSPRSSCFRQRGVREWASAGTQGVPRPRERRGRVHRLVRRRGRRRSGTSRSGARATLVGAKDARPTTTRSRLPDDRRRGSRGTRRVSLRRVGRSAAVPGRSGDAESGFRMSGGFRIPVAARGAGLRPSAGAVAPLGEGYLAAFAPNTGGARTSSC